MRINKGVTQHQMGKHRSSVIQVRHSSALTGGQKGRSHGGLAYSQVSPPFDVWMQIDFFRLSKHCGRWAQNGNRLELKWSVWIVKKKAGPYFYSKLVALVIQVTLNVFDETPSKAFRLQNVKIRILFVKDYFKYYARNAWKERKMIKPERLIRRFC